MQRTFLLLFNMFPSCLKDINSNTTIKYHNFLWASRGKSGIWRMFCISKTRADRGKLVLFLESAGQICPETGLTFETPKCVLASVIYHVLYKFWGEGGAEKERKIHASLHMSSDETENRQRDA